MAVRAAPAAGVASAGVAATRGARAPNFVCLVQINDAQWLRQIKLSTRRMRHNLRTRCCGCWARGSKF